MRPLSKWSCTIKNKDNTANKEWDLCSIENYQRDVVGFGEQIHCTRTMTQACTGNRIFDNERSPYIYTPRPVSKTPKMHPENYFCNLSSKFAGCMVALCIPNNRVFSFVFSADFNIFGEKWRHKIDGKIQISSNDVTIRYFLKSPTVFDKRCGDKVWRICKWTHGI